MFSGQTIMSRASVLLLDEEHVRWPLAELCNWINEAVAAIMLAKPSANTRSQVITLKRGTLQHLEEVTNGPKPLQLIDLKRNIIEEGGERLSGRTIRVTNGAILDASAPEWHNPRFVPFTREARQYVYDELNPLEFYVYPGNDGTGLVEAVLSFMPAALVPSGPIDEIGSYSAEVGLQDTYQAPLLDYVLYRCFSKDDLGSQRGAATTHYQAFATALGIKIQVEGSSSPNARRAR